MSDAELAYRIVMGALVGAGVVLVVSIVIIGGRCLYPAVDPERPWPDVRGYGMDVKNLVRQIEENGAAVLLSDDDLSHDRETTERRVRARAYSYRRSLARVLGAPVVLTWDRDRRGVLRATFQKKESQS